MSISLEQFPLLESERDRNKKPMDTHPPLILIFCFKQLFLQVERCASIDGFKLAIELLYIYIIFYRGIARGISPWYYPWALVLPRQAVSLKKKKNERRLLAFSF
jgi:hypothetical protein